jgi:hypothetical protein
MWLQSPNGRVYQEWRPEAERFVLEMDARDSQWRASVKKDEEHTTKRTLESAENMRGVLGLLRLVGVLGLVLFALAIVGWPIAMIMSWIGISAIPFWDFVQAKLPLIINQWCFMLGGPAFVIGLPGLIAHRWRKSNGESAAKKLTADWKNLHWHHDPETGQTRRYVASVLDDEMETYPEPSDLVPVPNLPWPVEQESLPVEMESSRQLLATFR